MATLWPATLPQSPLIAGLAEDPQDVSVRTQMETGPAKIRRRFTAEIRNIVYPLLLTTAQVETLDVLYYTTLEGGSLPFTHLHPRTGATVDYRFLEKPGPYTPLSHNKWSAELQLEILP